MKPKTNKWEREFDKKCEGDFGQECDCKKIKAFIHQTLQELKKKVEGMKGWKGTDLISKSDIIKLLEEYEKS